MKEALEFYKKHGIEECKKAYALSLNAGFEDLEMLTLITLNLIYREHDSVSIAKRYINHPDAKPEIKDMLLIDLEILEQMK